MIWQTIIIRNGNRITLRDAFRSSIQTFQFTRQTVRHYVSTNIVKTLLLDHIISLHPPQYLFATQYFVTSSKLHSPFGFLSDPSRRTVIDCRSRPIRCSSSVHCLCCTVCSLPESRGRRSAGGTGNDEEGSCERRNSPFSD